MRSLRSIEETLTAYAGHSDLDAAPKQPMNRQWTDNVSVFGGHGRQVSLT